MSNWSGDLARNLKQLRESRSLTQQQMAKLAGLPRATWSQLESGSANPTLGVLHKVTLALAITLEELLSSPRTAGRLYPRGSLPVREKGAATLRRLLPDPIPGMEIDRMELPAGVRISGTPHTPGTHEYLTCETGELILHVGGRTFSLSPGDVVAFRGDQRHGYENRGARAAIGYSVVVLAPAV
jgi:XRE family transcriptional regulator, regulator of sulfur utilization